MSRSSAEAGAWRRLRRNICEWCEDARAIHPTLSTSPLPGCASRATLRKVTPYRENHAISRKLSLFGKVRSNRENWYFLEPISALSWGYVKETHPHIADHLTQHPSAAFHEPRRVHFRAKDQIRRERFKGAAREPLRLGHRRTGHDRSMPQQFARIGNSPRSLRTVCR